MKRLAEHELPDNVEALKRLVLEQQAYTCQLEDIITLFQRKRFGKSSEKDPGQGELFNEAESCVAGEASCSTDGVPKDKDRSTVTQSQRSVPAGRKPLPRHLPRVIQEHDLSDVEKQCSCGCEKRYIGDSVSEQLDIIPAKIQVIEHRRKKYVCEQCTSAPETAPMPQQPIPRSYASPGLLAYIAVSKYQDALPLYRQSEIFKRLDVHLPRNTLSHWILATESLLQPLYNLLQDHLLKSGYIHMDETPVQVLNEPGKSASSKSYMWIRKTGDPNRSVVLFDYASSRGGNVAESLLPDYQGYLQTDDYIGYQRVWLKTGIQSLACWAHVRRKFIEAEQVAKTPKGKMGKAGMGVQLIKKLYAIEKRIRDLTLEDKHRIRQKESRPHLQKIKQWMEASLQTTLPKSRLGKALGYMQSNWDKLQVYLEDGRLNIDNNPVENAIRPFAVQWHSVKLDLF